MHEGAIVFAKDDSFYYYKDKSTLLQNVYNWLKPGGFFVVQLVDKNKFDPVVPAGKPFVMVNPQSFAEKRITTSNVIFNNFEYKSTSKYFLMMWFNLQKYLKIRLHQAQRREDRMFIICGCLPNKPSLINVKKSGL